MKNLKCFKSIAMGDKHVHSLMENHGEFILDPFDTQYHRRDTVTGSHPDMSIENNTTASPYQKTLSLLALT